jgi:peptidoglycan-N-acetylglucosamine deacetylase
MNFWTKPKLFIKKFFHNYIWHITNKKNKVFLTFDDGPTPIITEWTLDQLKKHNAKATFFCLGNNIEKHPEIVKRILSEGHSIGNHSFDHPNGWSTSTSKYVENALQCEEKLNKFNINNSKLFRPPYGRLKPTQSKALRLLGYKIIMWDILSGDYNIKITPEKCLKNVIDNIESGSIIIFHDSKKAFRNMEYTLPKTLEYLNGKGYVCERIN